MMKSCSNWNGDFGKGIIEVKKGKKLPMDYFKNFMFGDAIIKKL